MTAITSREQKAGQDNNRKKGKKIRRKCGKIRTSGNPRNNSKLHPRTD